MKQRGRVKRRGGGKRDRIEVGFLDGGGLGGEGMWMEWWSLRTTQQQPKNRKLGSSIKLHAALDTSCAHKLLLD
jgi:hypothetical protein